MQEVKIKIHGQQQNVQDEAIEVLSVGQMYREGEILFLEYEDVVGEEENGLVEVEKNQIRISGDMVEVIKKGSSQSHMAFVPEQTTYTYYSTPMGELEVSIHTDSIQRESTNDGMSFCIDYQLEMNQTFISNNIVNIEVEY